MFSLVFTFETDIKSVLALETNLPHIDHITLRILKIILVSQKICFRKFICLNDNIDHGTEEAKTVSVDCYVSCCVNSLNLYHFSPEVLDLE